MTPEAERIRAAVAELTEALIAAVSVAPPVGQVDELLDVPQAAARLGGIARSSVYQLMAAGELRSIKVGRRRLIPSSAITDLVERPPGERK